MDFNRYGMVTMALNHGVKAAHDRATEVAKELNGDFMMKTEMMREFNISFKTASMVYEIQGHKPLSRSEVGNIGNEAKAGIRRLSSWEIKKCKAENKLKEMVKYLKSNGYMRQTHIMNMFSCGKSLAVQAQKEAGVYMPTKKDRLSMDASECMYRPNGVNPLTRAWV